MPDSQQGFIEEAVTAGRGVIALIVGDRRASHYFDFSQKGLVGSFIGLLSITLVSAILPLIIPGASENYSIAKAAVIAAILFAFQIGFAAIVLRQMKRLDGLQPYLVADNWASFWISVGQLAFSLVGLGGDVAFFALAILVIVVEINISRLIVTLSPLQIAMFMIAQLVGVSIALIVVGVVFPAPEAAAALSSLPT